MASASVAAVLPWSSVWVFGDNGSSQLGDNSTTDRKVPTRVPGLSNVVAVAAGSLHPMALTSSGTVYTFGENTCGQIGNAAAPTDRKKPFALTSVQAIAAGGLFSMAVLANGDAHAWGKNTNRQFGNGGTAAVNASPS